MTKHRNSNLPVELEYVSVDDPNLVFSTYDIGLSAGLISVGFELIVLDKTNPRKVQFIFRREKGIESVADQYWANTLDVKARTLFENIKMLKNRLYSE